MSIELFIVDDHTLFRRGLCSLLSEQPGLEVVGEASHPQEAVQSVLRLRPDVVLMDIHMPGGDGVEAVAQITRQAPDIAILMLTVSEKDSDLVGAIQAGAKGYVLKNIEIDTLLAAIHRVHRGQAVLDPNLVSSLFHHVEQSQHTTLAAPSPLSPRETRILKLVAEDFTNQEIARHLHLSRNTIKTHLQRIYEKLGVNSRHAAVSQAQMHGWLSPITSPERPPG